MKLIGIRPINHLICVFCTMQILGHMSGSSLDGFDIACVDFSETDDGITWSLLNAETYSYSARTRELLSSIRHQKADEIARTEFAYSSELADALIDFRTKHGSLATTVSVHGHTVLHYPSLQKSWQLLNPGLLVSRTSLNLVHDFRSQDMALGGQGTPMAVIADRDLFPGFDYYLNLGGIANISGKENSHWYAYDLAPFNQVHNFFAAKCGLDYDVDGNLAKQGSWDDEIMQLLRSNEYLSKKAPKSIDNSEVRNCWIKPLEETKKPFKDILFNFNLFMAEMLEEILSERKGRILITGGGAKNRFFIELLNDVAKSWTEICIPEEEVIDYKEAILMAYMGYLRIHEKKNFISEASGASEDVCAGGLYLSNNKLAQ